MLNNIIIKIESRVLLKINQALDKYTTLCNVKVRTKAFEIKRPYIETLPKNK